MGHRGSSSSSSSSSVNKLFSWVRKQSMKVKLFLGLITALAALLALSRSVKDCNQFFVAAEAIHFAGILVLIYKLILKQSCSGN